MKIETYLEQMHVRPSDLSRQIGVTQPVLWQWMTGYRKVPIVRAIQIEQITEGMVTRRDLREDWRDIWPELAQQPAEAEHA